MDISKMMVDKIAVGKESFTELGDKTKAMFNAAVDIALLKEKSINLKAEGSDVPSVKDTITTMIANNVVIGKCVKGADTFLESFFEDMAKNKKTAEKRVETICELIADSPALFQDCDDEVIMKFKEVAVAKEALEKAQDALKGDIENIVSYVVNEKDKYINM